MSICTACVIPITCHQISHSRRNLANEQTGHLCQSVLFSALLYGWTVQIEVTRPENRVPQRPQTTWKWEAHEYLEIRKQSENWYFLKKTREMTMSYFYFTIFSNWPKLKISWKVKSRDREWCCHFAMFFLRNHFWICCQKFREIPWYCHFASFSETLLQNIFPTNFHEFFKKVCCKNFSMYKLLKLKRHTYQARQSVANARSGGFRITDPIIIQGFQEFLGFPGFLVFPIQINSVEPFDKVFIVDERSFQIGQLLKHFTRGHTLGKMMQ